MTLRDDGAVRWNLGRIRARPFVEDIPSPGIVAGGLDYLVGLDFTLHITGIVFILVDAHRWVLRIYGVVPVVVNTL